MYNARFSFQIKPNGQILRVYHPPDDGEVLETKRGLAAMLSAKLHDKDELSSESDMLPEQNEEYGDWKYQTEEIGNEGPHSARYIVKDTTTETEFKKIRNSKLIENSKGYFEKICQEERLKSTTSIQKFMSGRSCQNSDGSI
ncbi:Hypothetical predicted protein [Mytilus galloprovincialis]|uniref:Uncharacterized protein n=1 Tax=Mytilus galloprovincialis TaxID=29158 RepID=A0A8B6DVT6_MYTGA|nr:Hypothetical predicted protein [Mytilus galloprovincialis]